MSLQVEELGNGVVILRLDRPEQRNAFDTELLERVLGELDRHSRDENVRALVFSTTNTNALSAGADVAEQLDAEAGVHRMRLFANMYAAIEAFPVPTIAVCVGNVVGAGAELTLGCDLRVAGDNLKFAMVGGKLGVPVGPAKLVPLVGLSVATDLLLTGRTVGMEEAVNLRIAHRAATAEAAEGAALALAAEVAGHPSHGVRRIKELLREYEETAERVSRENEVLIEFQQGGSGLPSYND